MTIPFELRQKDLALPPAMAEGIRNRAGKLERFHPKIRRCVVSVQGPGPHHRQGACSVRIELHVPGAGLVVRKQDPAALEPALTAAFDAMSRRLEDQVRRARGFVKRHDVP